MKKGIFKIIFIVSIIIFFNMIKPCPTYIAYSLLIKNKISYKDIEKLNFNGLDFKYTGT